MTIEQICEFVTLAEQRNYLIAADIMYMTQATLSRHIISLEEELGYLLFNRTTKKIELTREGTYFLAYATQIAKLQKSYTEAIKRAKTINKNILRVGYHFLINIYGVNNMITTFITKNPDAKIRIMEENPKDLIELVKDGSCDIAIFMENPFERVHDVDYLRIHSDKLALVVNKHHRLANKTSITLDELKDEKFVTSTPEQQPISIMFEACRRAGITPNISKTGFVGKSFYDWISNHPDYIGLEWKEPASKNIDLNITVIDVKPDLNYHTLLIYNKLLLSSLGKQLIRYLVQECEEER